MTGPDVVDPSRIGNRGQIAAYERTYHSDQFETPKRSTLWLRRFLQESGVMAADTSVLDMGAGMGAVIHHLSLHRPDVAFTGLEADTGLVAAGNRQLEKMGSSAWLVRGDLYEPDPGFRGRFDGILSVQTLSWLDRWEAAVTAMAALAPRWIAITSLFYDGPVSCDVAVTEYFGPEQIPRDHRYRIYSLDRVRRLLSENGYRLVTTSRFEIDIDLPAPRDGLMRTYTERLADGRRLQLSGPMQMPWYAVLARKG